MGRGGREGEPEISNFGIRQTLMGHARRRLAAETGVPAMMRLTIFAAAAASAGLMAAAAIAQPADPNTKAQVQDSQARQSPPPSSIQKPADEQRQLWLQGLAPYEAKYGRGSYDEYLTAHPDVAASAVKPASKEESRGSVRSVTETPAR
jgi:hypothetical protein